MFLSQMKTGTFKIPGIV